MVEQRGKISFYETKSTILIVLLALIIAINVGNYFLLQENSSVLVTGHDTSVSAILGFVILGEPEFEIWTPENITYYFNASDTLALNMTGSSTDIFQLWAYSIYDIRHDRWFREDVAFGTDVIFPNYTNMPVVRWGNLLIVNGTTYEGKVVSRNVTFYVNVSNSAPFFTEALPNPLYVCEDGEFFDFLFNATDYDEDPLTNSQLIDPSGNFFLRWLGQSDEIIDFSISSGTRIRKGVGEEINVNQGSRRYPITVELTDDINASLNYTNITIIERNNPPVIVPNLSVMTLERWNVGDNATLFLDINISDVETSLVWGVLTRNLTITNSTGQVVPLFTLGPSDTINFTADNNTPVGVYDVNVCVMDYGITNPHPQIVNVCGQDGSNITTCDWFELTITDRNRPPTIVTHEPDNSGWVNVSSVTEINFNITDYDPDGTTPDTYWYVDNVLTEIDYGFFNDSFIYSFGCGVSGIHYVRVDVTDGLLNDSLTWNVSVSLVPCSIEPGGGGGGGGGGAKTCQPIWICSVWDVCQFATSSLNIGLLSGADFRFISDQCKENVIYEDKCGFHIRHCNDVNVCNVTKNKPVELESCYYTINPNCDDGIQNCHDDLCELLVDCGGPCDPCPTCSDEIRNQGEEGVDCGGPCPWKCEPEIPLIERSNTIYILLAIVLIVIIFVIFKLVRVLKYRHDIATRESQNI